MEIPSELAQEGEDVIMVEHSLEAAPDLVVETPNPEEQQDTEAPERGFSEFSEGSPEFKEIIELVPYEANPSDSANFFVEQGCSKKDTQTRTDGPEDIIWTSQGLWALTHGTFDRTMMYMRTRPQAMRAQFRRRKSKKEKLPRTIQQVAYVSCD
nr:uncharacterized protein LOC117837157 isoform X3 [Setaria viridis]